jgi:hypothetical protein
MKANENHFYKFFADLKLLYQIKYLSILFSGFDCQLGSPCKNMIK